MISISAHDSFLLSFGFAHKLCEDFLRSELRHHTFQSPGTTGNVLREALNEADNFRIRCASRAATMSSQLESFACCQRLGACSNLFECNKRSVERAFHLRLLCVKNSTCLTALISFIRYHSVDRQGDLAPVADHAYTALPTLMA